MLLNNSKGNRRSWKIVVVRWNLRKFGIKEVARTSKVRTIFCFCSILDLMCLINVWIALRREKWEERLPFGCFCRILSWSSEYAFRVYTKHYNEDYQWRVWRTFTDPGLMEFLNYVGKLYFPETCHDGTGKGRGNGGWVRYCGHDALSLYGYITMASLHVVLLFWKEICKLN